MQFNDIMKKVWSDVQELIPGHVERLSWSQAQVREHQTKKLRALLKTAKEKTKYYAEVLADVDVDNFNPEDLSLLPPHDKIVHMDRWDDFSTTPELTYEIAEKHMEDLFEERLLFSWFLN